MWKRLTILKISFALVCAAVLYGWWVNPLTPDAWLRMGVGRYIYEFREIPSHYDLSYKDPLSGFGWISHSWLADLIIYLAVLAAGEKLAVYLVGLPLLGACIWLINDMLKTEKADEELRWLGMVWAGVAGLMFWGLHPLTFFFTLMLGLVWILVQRPVKGGWLAVVLSILFGLMANLTGGYVAIGFVLLLVYLGWDLVLRRLKKGQPKSQVWVWVSLPGLALVSLLNPYGVQIWEHLLTFAHLTTTGKWFSTLPGALAAANSSYVKETISNFRFVTFLGFGLGFLTGFLLLIVRKSKLFIDKAGHLFFLLPGLFLGLIWVRFLPLAMILTMVLGLKMIEVMDKRWQVWVKFGLAVLTLGVSIWSIYGVGTTAAKDDPKKLIAAVKDMGLQPNFMTTGELTGVFYYAMFPQRANIDILDDIYDEMEDTSVYSYSMGVGGGFLQNVTENYAINTVAAGKDADFMVQDLAADPAWGLVYIDYSGYVFARLGGKDEKWKEEWVLSALNLNRNLGFDPEKIQEAEMQLERFVAKYKNNHLAMGQLATVKRLAGKLDQAERLLVDLKKLRPGFVVYTELGRLYAGAGKCESAEENYLSALAYRDEKNFSRAVLDLAVLYAGCIKDIDKAKHYFRRYDSYALPPTERERVRKIADDFGIRLDQ